MRKNVRVAKREGALIEKEDKLAQCVDSIQQLPHNFSHIPSRRKNDIDCYADDHSWFIKCQTCWPILLLVLPIWFRFPVDDDLPGQVSLLAGNDPIGSCDSLFNIQKIKRRGPKSFQRVRNQQDLLKVQAERYWSIFEKKCGSDGLILSKPGQQQDTTDDCSRSWLPHARLLFSRPSQAHSTI